MEEVGFPETIHELCTQWAQSSLRQGFLGMGEEEGMPEHIKNSGFEVRRAANELRKYYEQQLAVLGRIAAQTLSCYTTEAGHEAALHSFHSALFANRAGVLDFLDEPHGHYLRGLIAHSVSDAERFKTLLQLFVELAPRSNEN